MLWKVSLPIMEYHVIVGDELYEFELEVKLSRFTTTLIYGMIHHVANTRDSIASINPDPNQ